MWGGREDLGVYGRKIFLLRHKVCGTGSGQSATLFPPHGTAVRLKLNYLHVNICRSLEEKTVFQMRLDYKSQHSDDAGQGWWVLLSSYLWNHFAHPYVTLRDDWQHTAHILTYLGSHPEQTTRESNSNQPMAEYFQIFNKYFTDGWNLVSYLPNTN